MNWRSTIPTVEDVKLCEWDAKYKLAEASGCRIDSHCSGEARMPTVAIAASRQVAWRGYPVAVDSLDVAPEWPGLINSFCAKLGINVEGKRLGWWLVSMWTY